MIGLQKIVGLFVCLVPVFAGFVMAQTPYLIMATYHDCHRRPGRFEQPTNPTVLLITVVFSALLIVGLQVSTYFLYQRLTLKDNKPEIFSRTGWRILILGSYGVGCLTGALDKV